MIIEEKVSSIGKKKKILVGKKPFRKKSYIKAKRHFGGNPPPEGLALGFFQKEAKRQSFGGVYCNQN